jgi:hypothetical protein
MALRRKKHNHHLHRKLPIEHTGFYPYLQYYLEVIAVKGYAQMTQDRHESHIRCFAVWCEERGLDSPAEITKPILERYQKRLYYYRKTNVQPLSFTLAENNPGLPEKLLPMADAKEPPGRQPGVGAEAAEATAENDPQSGTGQRVVGAA